MYRACELSQFVEEAVERWYAFLETLSLARVRHDLRRLCRRIEWIALQHLRPLSSMYKMSE